MKRIAVASLSLLALSLAGCGGSGTATDSANLPSGSATRAEANAATESAAVAAAPFSPLALTLSSTDAANPTWSHVWVVVHKVEGLGADEKATPLFTSGEGFLVDLTAPSALPGAGVASATTPSFTRLRLTLAPGLHALKPGQTTVETISLLPALPKDAEGRAVSTLTLPKPFEGNTPLALSADLSKLLVTDGKAGLALALGTPPKSLPLVTVAGIVRGDVLTVGGGGRVQLISSATTLFVNADGSPSPKLSEGTKVLATGTLSLDGKSLTAQKLVVGTQESAALEGTVSDIDTKLATFSVSAFQFTGILPSRLSATVTLGEKAILRGRGGLLVPREAFLSALGETGATVRLEGSYEPTTGAFTARRASLLGGTSHDVRLVGSLTLDEKSSALTLTKPTEWDGFSPTDKGTALTTTSATAYTDDMGKELTRAAFMESARERTATATGLLSPEGKLTATKLTLSAPLPKPEPEKKAELEKKAAAPVDPKKS